MTDMKNHPTIKMLRYLTRYLQMFVKKQRLDLQSLGYAEILGKKKAIPKAKSTRKPKAKPPAPPKSPPSPSSPQAS